jgi:DNA-binding MarR family transcriptional regulator
VAGVKRSRAYDGRGRQEQARATRERVIDVARSVFLENGYGPTTVQAVAAKAGVSVETIYKGFGGKPGLVRAIQERGLEGRGPRPAESRSNEVSAREEDPRVIVKRWGDFVVEISPIVSPMHLLIRSAAASEPELASLLREIDDARLARMTQNARMLEDRGFLRPEVSVDEAAEIMWGYTAPELYELLVVRRGWSPRDLGTFVAEALEAALLRPPKLEDAPSLLDVVARAARVLKGAIQVPLERHGVHAGQNFILERLWDRDGQTPGEIAEAIGVEGPTVVRALQRMAAAGLVIRKKHPTDGRQVAIHLTPAGAQLRTSIPKALRRVEEQAFEGVSKEDQTRLFELLQRLSANLV